MADDSPASRPWSEAWDLRVYQEAEARGLIPAAALSALRAEMPEPVVPEVRPSVPTRLGALYDEMLMRARGYARDHGYALAVHGSQMRDLDLIAVPWTAEASAPEVLVEAIRKAVNGTYSAGSQAGNDVVTHQPHGRLSWAIHLEDIDPGLRDALVGGKVPFRPYIDLSVMPLEATDAR